MTETQNLLHPSAIKRLSTDASLPSPSSIRHSNAPTPASASASASPILPLSLRRLSQYSEDGKLPSNLSFRTSSVQIRGGELLQASELESRRILINLHQQAIILQIRHPHSEPINATPGLNQANATPTASMSRMISKKRIRGTNGDSIDESSNSIESSVAAIDVLPPPTSEIMAAAANHISSEGAKCASNEQSTHDRVTSLQPLSHKRTRTTNGRPLLSPSSPIKHPSSEKWVIPLSQVVGVDFSISLDTPPSCTFALRPCSPAAVVEASALQHPYVAATRRSLPPFLSVWWRNSSWISCSLFITACALLISRFWLTATVCFVAYFILLIQQLRLAQSKFLEGVLGLPQPVNACRYIHVIFAHDCYTSFLSFRRLFIAAAPAFSVPSASSTAPTLLVSSELPSMNTTAFSPSVQQRYPLEDLQKILPTAPLFFGSVYADLCFYLLLTPQLFASSRIRSVAHFLLPVLYLGQAMVSAVHALTPLAVQGYLYLAPFLLMELHWFVRIANAIPNPLMYLIELLLPLGWIQSVLSVWLMHIASAVYHYWSETLRILYLLSAPARWMNALLTPILEFIREEARALWGLSVLLKPLLVTLNQLKTIVAEIGGSLAILLSSISSIVSNILSGLVPMRLFSLFASIRTGVSATASVSSGIAASGGVSRWRAMWQSLQEFFSLIGKWKLLIDRVRQIIQIWYYELISHVRDAKNVGQQHQVKNINFDVPLVPALERTISELHDEQLQADATTMQQTPLPSPRMPAVHHSPQLKQTDNNLQPPPLLHTASPAQSPLSSRVTSTTVTPASSNSSPSIRNPFAPLLRVELTPLSHDSPFRKPSAVFSGFEHGFIPTTTPVSSPQTSLPPSPAILFGSAEMRRRIRLQRRQRNSNADANMPSPSAT